MEDAAGMVELIPDLTFEAFVEQTNRVISLAHLYEIFIRRMTLFGLDLINFTVMRDGDVPEKYLGFGIISTYPARWQRYYETHGCAKYDPVLKCAISSSRPFYWRDLERRTRLSRKQIAFLRKAEKSGLHHGVGIPFNGPRTQIAGVALASSNPSPVNMPSLELIFGYCNQFYISFKRILGTAEWQMPPMFELTPKESEVMVCVAHGLKSVEIADVLGMKANTVESHIRDVILKFGASNRGEAATLALYYGLIDLKPHRNWGY